MQPIEVIRADNVLGENVLWHHPTGTVWWTDIHARRLFCYSWADKALQCHETPERLCSFGFMAEDNGRHQPNVVQNVRLIAAFESGIALYDPVAKAIEWLGRPEADIAHIRFNDGRVDRQGRFWAGTMVEGIHDDVSANLYCIDHHGVLACRKRDIRISNGLCFTIDGRYMYFADSPRGCIHRFDMQEGQGSLHDGRLFAQLASGAEPDGATIDSEGYMWSAHWGGGRVVRYSPEGVVDRVLPLPVSQPTCAAFGGPNLDLLFVTSARDGLGEQALLQQPDAGAVFVYDVGVKGLPESHFLYHSSFPGDGSVRR